MHWRIYGLWTLLATMALMWIPKAARGCSCIGTSTVASALKYSDFVAVGVVKSRTRVRAADMLGPDDHINGQLDTLFYDRIKYTVEIVEAYKGEQQRKTIELFTGMGDGDCGVDLAIGGTYIIYAHSRRLFFREGSKLKTNITSFLSTDTCTRTVEVNKKELKRLQAAVASARKKTSPR